MTAYTAIQVHEGTHLQCEHRFTILESASGDGTASTLTQAPHLDNLLLFAGRMPAFVIQILHIEWPALLQAQLIQVREQSIHAGFALHLHATVAVRVHRADRR